MLHYRDRSESGDAGALTAGAPGTGFHGKEGENASPVESAEALKRKVRRAENARSVLAGLYRAAGCTGQIQEQRYADLKDKYDELEQERLGARSSLAFDYSVMREAMEQLEVFSRKALDHWTSRFLRSESLFCRALGKLASGNARLLARVIRSNPLFDAQWYVEKYPDVRGADPVLHYLTHGWREGRDPSPYFSTQGYALQQGLQGELCPLLHFLRFGRKEDIHLRLSFFFLSEVRLLRESALMDTHWYLEQYPDVSGSDPVIHYLTRGWREGRDPSAAFSTSKYLKEYPEVRTGGFNPLVHYLMIGRSDGCLPCPDSSRSEEYLLLRKSRLFRPDWYRKRYPDTADADPIEHYLTSGWKEGRDPSPEFSTGFYLENNPDLRAGGTNPLVHYLRRGAAEGRRIKELSGYLAEHFYELARLSGLFDSKWYKERYGEEPDPQADPLREFCRTAWREGRDPSPRFSQRRYWLDHRDLDWTNGLFHYIVRGALEDREIEPVEEPVCGVSRRRRIAVLVPDASEAGAGPGLEICRHLRAMAYLVKIIVMKPGPALAGFGRCGEVFCPSSPEELRSVAEDLRSSGCRDAILDSAAACKYVKSFHEAGFRTVLLIRETGGAVKDMGLEAAACEAAGYGDELIFPAASVADSWKEAGLAVPAERLRILPPVSCERKEAPLEGEEAAARDRTARSGHHAMSAYVSDILECTSAPFRKISCIVPVRGRGQYLVPRLDSFRAQTCPVYELIILDDNSSDGRDKVIRAWIEADPDFFQGGIRYIRNETDRGVFAQWRQGISLACGELVWIAGADDTCDPRLAGELIPFFDDPMVNLAYVQSRLIDSGGKVLVPDLSVETGGISPARRKEPCVCPFERELNSGLAVADTIPNAGAVIMRKTAALGVSDLPERFELLGEWVFYLEVLKGGRIGFSPAILADRRRPDPGAETPEGERTAREIERIHRLLLDSCRLGNETIRRMREALLTACGRAGSPFVPTLDYDRYLQPEKREPGVLIFSGSLTYGGGEIFPIWLANELAGQGYRVYLLSFDLEPPNTDIVEKVDYRVNLVRMAEIAGQGLRNFISEKGIGFISSHFYHADKFLAAELGDAEVFWTVTTHGMYEHLVEHPEEDPDFPAVFPKIFRRCSKVIYTAPKNLVPFRKLDFDIGSKCVKIDNGFPYSHETPFDRGSYGIGEKDKVLVFVARGIPEKGWKEVIALVSDLNGQREEAGFAYHAVLIGDSGYVRGLKNRYGADPHLHFLGYRKDIAPFVAGSDIGLLPSTFIGESQPLILIEFFANGKPVVATRIGEVPLMVAQDGVEAGVLLDIGEGHVSRPEFAKAVRAMEDTNVYRTYSEGAKKIFEHYSIENCAAGYMKLYFENRAGGS